MLAFRCKKALQHLSQNLNENQDSSLKATLHYKQNKLITDTVV